MKLQYNSLAFVAGLNRATDEGSLPEIAQYSPYYLPLNVFTASKGSNIYILFPAKFDRVIRKIIIVNIYEGRSESSVIGVMTLLIDMTGCCIIL